MYSPLDLSMQHRLRWQEFLGNLLKQGFLTEEYPIADDPDKDAKINASYIRKALCSDAHFYVEKNVQDLVALAERNMPEIEFNVSWMQAESGWLELTEPIDFAGEKISIIGWVSLALDKNWLVFTFLSVVPDFDCENLYSAQICHGTSLKDFQDRTDTHIGPYVSRFLFALMHILSQKIAKPAPAEIRHNIRGQAVARGIHAADHPRIIVLRRAERERSHETDGAPREFHWQWIVGGHWRRQPYPSEGVVRNIFIASYIKGPADKPLKQPSAKIFVARR